MFRFREWLDPIDHLHHGTAAEVETTKADLISFANLLATPLNQADCVGRVTKATPGVMAWHLGEGVSDDELGHIESLTLHLQCNVTATSTLPDACDHSANTPDNTPPEPQDGFTLDGAVSFFGLFGTGSTKVRRATYSFSTPPCRSAPCSFVLSEFDVELDSFTAGSFEFIDPQLELATRASGWREGDEVELPVGALRFEVSAAVKINGEYLLGERRFVFEFSNTEAVRARLSVDRAFTVEQAEFDIYGEHARLNTN